MSATALRVGYDREVFVRQLRGGVSRYYAELIRAFASQPKLAVEPTLLFNRCGNQHLATAVPQLVRAMPSLRPVPRGVPRLLNRGDALKDAFLRYRAGGDGVRSDDARLDWLHATYFRPMPSDTARTRRLAMTVYDMIPEQLGLDTRSGPHQGKLALARRADLVLAISQATADLLLECAPELGPKVVVTPLGVDLAAFAPATAQSGHEPKAAAPFPYVLFVGTRGGYKRFDVALAAVRELRTQGHDLGLVIAGPPVGDDERAHILAHLPEDRVLSCTPDDSTLARLYQQAAAFIFPSLMEGFGLPLLEAFAAGCPVVASDIPVFREVGGTAARYFAPGDSQAAALTIAHLLEPQTTDAARIAGRQIAEAHTWQATAERTAAAYRSRA